MTTPNLYAAACEMLAIAAWLVQQMRPAGGGVEAPAACAHPLAAREARGTLAAPWKRFFCRDCSQVISPKE